MKQAYTESYAHYIHPPPLWSGMGFQDTFQIGAAAAAAADPIQAWAAHLSAGPTQNAAAGGPAVQDPQSTTALPLPREANALDAGAGERSLPREKPPVLYHTQ